MTSSDSICKFMSCSFPRSVPDLVNHQYGICRMYSEENRKRLRDATIVLQTRVFSFVIKKR